MSDSGGGAEARSRSKQYEYRANSSLVLTSDTRHCPLDAREPESLRGKIDPRTFGDRVYRDEASKKKRNKERESLASEANSGRESKKRRIRQEESVFTLIDEGVYQPKSRETRAAYEALLSFIQQQLGGQPVNVVRGAADEVLGVLKHDNLKNHDKKKEIEKLLNNSISNQVFDHVVSIGRLITDYQDAAAEGDDDLDDNDDDDVGVAVEFEENEEVGGICDYDLVEEDEEVVDDAVCANPSGAMQVGGGIEDADDEMQDAASDRGMTLNVRDIDAYWLQRKISEAYGDHIDAQQSQKLAEEILEILTEGNDCDVELKLLFRMQFDKFSLVKFMLQNRLKIVWCTRLARAEGEEDRKKIEEQMVAQGRDHAAILEQLHRTRSRATAKERQKNLKKSIRDEARGLKDETGRGDGQREKRVLADRDADGCWLSGKRQLIDLDSLAFHQGGLFLANKRCELPGGSFRNQKKGYEEVHVPALKPKPLAPGEELIKISSMPAWAQPAFRGMTQLNRIQSRVYETALFSADNILLCAPTGAGKTNVAMLTILQQIALNRNQDGSFNHNNYKIVYVAPMKALVAEVVGNLSKRLQDYDVKVKELSGDQTLTRQQIEETQIIVTTPEKWDIVTRKSVDRTYTQLVKLLIIDEIHLLHDNRGPVLESIVARSVRQIETTKEHIRLVGLSATLPNYEDVALFLRVDVKKGLFHFDNSYRPVPLAQQYVGITVKKLLQRFQLMNDVCYEKVINVAGKHQVLIFVHSRKDTARTARAIRDAALANDTLGKFLKEDSASREILQSHTELVKNNDLKDLLPYGFAIHHAGMGRADRQIVEDLFSGGHAQVLVSTATLAWGVNLPAHTVIIKGTQIYNPEKGAWTELSPLDVMQMLGRAGRPQFDTYGEGIIITGHSDLRYYLSLMNQQLPIESHFLSKLADQLNAEIVLGSVQNDKEACTWLAYTYLNLRMLQNPSLYGLDADDALSVDNMLEERRADLVYSAATLLHKNNLVKYDRKSGYFQVTDLGRIASYYYITHKTISTFNEHLKPTMGNIDLCHLFSLSEEFKYVTVRQDEKVELAKLLNRVPIPIKESIEEPSAKINVLLQAYISQLKLEGLSLASDMVFITQSAGRLMRALFEIVLKRGWAKLTEKALKWCKMIDKRMWSVQTPLRQFHGIPNEILMKLEKKDLAWERYYDLSSQEIGELIRFPKMGSTLHKLIHQFPKLNLAAHVLPITPSVLKVELTITPDFKWDDKVHGFVEPFWVIVEDNDGENILHHEYFLLKKQHIDEDHTLDFTVSTHEPLPPQYFIRVVSDRWLGSQTILPVSFRHLILPDKYPPPTELLDLQPLPVRALRNPSYEALYQEFKHFNPVQTQVFTTLYNSDDNVLVAAPTGSGKTICAEFAILRNHQKGPESILRAVYIAPIEALAKVRYNDWKRKFGDGLGMKVVELTGETVTDIKLLERGHIIISTPEKWDAVSRRWKQQKHVQQVSLFIVDELHLIGGQGGPILEVIVSRMRYIASQLENKLRIVALSTSLANAKDLGEWIGANSHSLFNFPPGVRPVPLDIHIHSIDIANFEARMQAMAKPTYTAIVKHTKEGKPAIVFVPSRKHACLTAVDLMTHASVDTDKIMFLLQSAGDLEPFIDRIKEPTLKETLRHGVGYLHEGLTGTDQDVVKTLFETGRIQVCIMSSSMCWGVALSAHLVVIMGTQHHDGKESAYRDYPLTDLLQMMGRASRPLIDNSGKCVILCHAPRKEYYKKFLYETFPVESHLHHYLHDNLNAEVVVRVIQNKQEAVDYLTWTFMYRRLTQNPNYYNLQGVNHRHLSDHLSELVENTISDLESSKCVLVGDDFLLSPLNLGRIASYYYISCSTIECFSSSLKSKTRLKGLLDILASASEYEQLPVRPGEEELIRRLINHQRFSFDNSKCTDPQVKANALLQAHFSRQLLGGNLASDQQEVLIFASRLLQAMVDVISSNGWLSLALLAMEVSQMVTQGMWEHDSMLLQLPHFTKELAKKCQENPRKSIETVFDLVEMEDDERRELLQMSDLQLLDIARFCNRFPNIDLAYDVPDGDNVRAGENIMVHVTLERDLEGRAEIGPVDAPRYPQVKEEGWWLVVGDTKTDQLLANKRVTLQGKSKVRLDFEAPAEAGRRNYMLYFMSDSYVGCDQEYSFTNDVKETATQKEAEENDHLSCIAM